MVKTIDALRVSWPEITVPDGDGVLLRGAVAAAMPGQDLLHNHVGGGFAYRYPLVQYKILNGHPTVFAAEEAIPAVESTVRQLKSLTLGSRTFSATSPTIQKQPLPIGDADDIYRYQITTPWIALNQNNIRLWNEADDEGKRALLRRILIGNILSQAKGFGVCIENNLVPNFSVYESAVHYKHEKMLCFTGEFQVQAYLPAGFGLGKGVSRGFGTVFPLQIL